MDVTGHVPLWPTNQRSATYPPNTTSTADPGRCDPAHEADSTTEAPIPGLETLDRAHQGPLPPQTRRQSTGAKPDREPPNQMGQHRRGGRGHAVPPVSGEDGQQRQNNHSQPPISQEEHHAGHHPLIRSRRRHPRHPTQSTTTGPYEAGQDSTTTTQTYQTLRRSTRTRKPRQFF